MYEGAFIHTTSRPVVQAVVETVEDVEELRPKALVEPNLGFQGLVHVRVCTRAVTRHRLTKIAQKGEAQMLTAPTIRQVPSAAPIRKGSTMKLRYLKATYALALLVAFVVAAGAGSKFHGNG